MFLPRAFNRLASSFWGDYRPARRTLRLVGKRRAIPAALLVLLAVIMGAGSASQARAQANNLSVKWDELTAADFVTAIQKAQGVCVLPIGILEKHGPHLPIGNDLINIRYVSLQAAQQEYAVVFPEYYFGQIFEARHEPGTIAYSRRIQLDLLQETTEEMGRNGCKKIVIANGHGGNNHLLPYFAQSQMADSGTITWSTSSVRRDSAVCPGGRRSNPTLAGTPTKQKLHIR